MKLQLWTPFIKPVGCDGCILRDKGKSFVPGKGDEDAKLVIVMERPGKHEAGTCDCQAETHPRGEPIVYKSSKEFDIGLGGGRAGTYITNVRKCLGDDKETPEIREASIAHCVRAYLNIEFEKLKTSTTLLAVGADALRVTTGLREATKFHGSVWSREEVEAIAKATKEDKHEEDNEEENEEGEGGVVS